MINEHNALIYWRDQTLKLIKFLQDQRFTNKQIGDALGISRQAVALLSPREGKDEK